MANTDVFGAIKEMCSGLLTKANEIASEVQKSRVNVNKVVHEILADEAATDEKVKAWQEWDAKAAAAREKRRSEIEAHVKENLVASSSMSDEVYEAKKAEYSELKKSINSTKSLAANLPGYSEEVFSDLPALQTLSGGTAGSATGTKRPRLSSLTINGEEVYTEKKNDDDTVSKSFTFTAAANHISKDAGTKVQPSDLSGAAFEAAKTDDLSTVASVDFNYSVNGKEYNLVVIPQSND
jgi:hypothetical protein